VADHFQYLACIGIITAASAGAALLLDRAIPAVRAAGWGLIAALVATFAILSNAQSRTYADQPTLYKATIERNPDCWMAYNNLGVWYQRRGNLDEAIAQYSAALRIKKDYAAAHDNLGTVLLKMPGRLDEATAHFQEALRLQPDYAEAHNELGVAWLNTPGRLNDAIAQFQEVVRLSPDFPEGRNNLGDALLRIPDRTNEAIAQFVEALRLRPSYAEAHSNLGTALYAKGRMGEAVAQYKEALRLKPVLVKVHYNIALALLRTPGGADEAEEQLEAFLKIMPDNEMARRILAQIRANHP